MGDVARPDRLNPIVIEQRRQQVATLYLAHQTQRAIAQQLGVDPATICLDLQALRQEWIEERRFAVDQIMERELVELDEMEAYAARQLAATADREGKVAWFNQRMKVKERRAKMLRFDAPAVEESNGHGTGIDVERARSEFAQALLAVADEGEARRRVERALAASSVVIEGGLGDDPGAAGAATAAGGLDGLADQPGSGVGEVADREPVDSQPGKKRTV